MEVLRLSIYFLSKQAINHGLGSGLGKIVAKCFLVNGASVTLVDIVQSRLDQSRLDEVKSEFESAKKDLKLKGEIKT